MNKDDLLEITTNICLDSLSDEEILWYKFSSKLGFNPESLHKIIKHNSLNQDYKIMGLTWRYSNIKISDANNVINNELYVHLKEYYDFKVETTINKNQIENEDIDLTKILSNPPGTMVFQGTLDPSSYTITSTSVREEYFCGDEQRINEKIKNKDLNELYLSMEEFISKFNTDEIIKEKKDFTKLKYGIEILWTSN